MQTEVKIAADDVQSEIIITLVITTKTMFLNSILANRKRRLNEQVKSGASVFQDKETVFF